MLRSDRVAGLHQRLTVVFDDTVARHALASALAGPGRVVDQAELTSAVKTASADRRSSELAQIEQIQAEITAERAPCEEIVELRDRLVAEQHQHRVTAGWCAGAATADAADRKAESAKREEVSEHDRKARAATRQLDQVLAQRVVAEEALATARRELTGLGGGHLAEADLRRELEAAISQAQSAEEDVIAGTDGAYQQLDDARRRVSDIERELDRRSHDRPTRQERQDAEAALEAQVDVLEAQLRQAEASARRDVEDTARELSRLEADLDRIRRRLRERRNRLESVIANLAEDDRPDEETDMVEAAAEMAEPLRRRADALETVIDQTGRAIAELDRQTQVMQTRIDELHARGSNTVSDDITTAVDQLAASVDGPVVLDDPELDERTQAGLAALTNGPVVVLSADVDATGWAIELPSEAASVMTAASVHALVDAVVDLGDAPPSHSSQTREAASSRNP